MVSPKQSTAHLIVLYLIIFILSYAYFAMKGSDSICHKKIGAITFAHSSHKHDSSPDYIKNFLKDIFLTRCFSTTFS